MVTKQAPPIVETVTEDDLSTPTSFEEVVEGEDELEAEEEETNPKNYESDLDEGGSSVGSTETNYANDADYEGPLLLGPTTCRVILGAKTDLGEDVCCGTTAKTCARRGHADIRANQSARVAQAGIYVGKRNNKDRVDGVINSFVSEADYAAQKARDRASIDALSQSDQKKASEALLSPKATTVAFDTSGAPPTRSTSFASCIPTPRTPSKDISAPRTKPILKVNTASANAVPSPAHARTVPESTTELQAMIKTMKSKASLEAPKALNVQTNLSKTQDSTTDTQLREALMCDANLQRMMETLMSNQASPAAKSANKRKTKATKPKKKPHYWAVTCGWHLGIFKLPTDLEEYQKATLDFPKSKLSSRKFSTRTAATRWFESEIAASDDDGTELSDSENSEDKSSTNSDKGQTGQSRLRGGGIKEDRRLILATTPALKTTEHRTVMMTTKRTSTRSSVCAENLPRKKPRSAKRLPSLENRPSPLGKVVRSRTASATSLILKLSDLILLWVRRMKFSGTHLRYSPTLLTFYAPKVLLWMFRRN
jgi:hypothetical protein